VSTCENSLRTYSGTHLTEHIIVVNRTILTSRQ